MKDIARDLGISVVTVSKVFHNHPDIGEETRKRVLKRMKELNYQPNMTARALITGQTWIIGLIVPDLLHPFFAGLAQSISATVRKNGYQLLIASSDEEAELEKQAIEQFLARSVDMLLIASTQWSVESFRHIEEQKTPYILLDRQFSGLEANFVGVDDHAVGVLATEHLIAQGCQRIAHIRGPRISTAAGRAKGYRDALTAAGMTSLPGHIVSLGDSGDHRGENGGYEAACQLLAAKQLPDGIFCFNDPSALGAMRAILDAGLRIPEDIAVIGCGNLFYSDFLRVPLSSMDQDNQAIGQLAANLALKLVQSKTPLRPCSELVTPRLVIRTSSSRIGSQFELQSTPSLASNS
jgi:LacI family transcriptional regulator